MFGSTFYAWCHAQGLSWRLSVIALFRTLIRWIKPLSGVCTSSTVLGWLQLSSCAHLILISALPYSTYGDIGCAHAQGAIFSNQPTLGVSIT